jgi:cyclic pyranopterin phosphate synthase
MTRARLTHLDARNVARMVDVGAKPPTHRVAVAEAFVRAATPVLDALEAGSLQKGDALAVARLAGILAAKRTSELIPLAHPIALTHVAVDVILERDRGGVRIEARCETIGATGVEMEALTAASVAALTVYDMTKALDKGIEIQDVYLVEKTGGKSGVWRRVKPKAKR